MSTPDVKPLTQRQAAALLGVTERHFRRICAEEASGPTQIVGNGKQVAGYPCEPFGQWLRARWAKDIGATADGEVYDEKVERARLLHHQANNEALKEQVNRGELIPAPLVLELGSAVLAATRTKVLAIHSKLRQRFPGIDKAIAEETERLSREALQELGDDGLPSEVRRRIHG